MKAKDHGGWFRLCRAAVNSAKIRWRAGQRLHWRRPFSNWRKALPQFRIFQTMAGHRANDSAAFWNLGERRLPGRASLRSISSGKRSARRWYSSTKFLRSSRASAGLRDLVVRHDIDRAFGIRDGLDRCFPARGISIRIAEAIVSGFSTMCPWKIGAAPAA
jgi:hypothetical protein